jgi:hypothetical protein
MCRGYVNNHHADKGSAQDMDYCSILSDNARIELMLLFIYHFYVGIIFNDVYIIKRFRR